MRTFEQTASALGAPLFLAGLRDLDGRAVAVGRWRHGNVRLGISSADALRVVLVVGGVHDVRIEDTRRVACVSAPNGFVGVLPPGASSETTVEGEGDIVQVFIDADGLGHPAGGWPELDPLVAVEREDVRAAVVATFVAVRAGDGPRSRRAATALLRAARRLLPPEAGAADRFQKGGLRAAARRRVERMIEQRLDAPWICPLTVEMLADEAGLSVNHFIRAFREMTGATPYQHLLARRRQRAMVLLGKPGLLVAEIADRLGFCSSAHFTASFRKSFGITPGEYRDAVLRHGPGLAAVPCRSPGRASGAALASRRAINRSVDLPA